jgi:hypothetical protein
MVTTLSPPGPIRTPLWLSGGLPVLAGQDKPNDGLFFPRNTIPKGIFYGALRFADPIKIGAYSLAFLLAWNVLYVEPRRAAAQETYRREYASAAYEAQFPQSTPEAFRTL